MVMLDLLCLLFCKNVHPATGSPTVKEFLALCFFFQQITEGSYWSASIAIGNQLAGAAGGILNTGANIMGIVTALLVPWIAVTFSWQVAIAAGAVFSILGLVLMLFVRADEAISLD